MKHAWRKPLAGLAVLAGVGLIVLEVSRYHGRELLDEAFWLLLGVMVIALGLVELFSKGER